MSKTVVILPAYNAGRFLGKVIDDIVALHPDFIPLVIDDGSSDNTAEVAELHNAKLIKHPVNKGKGAALITGFDFVANNDVDWAFTMDSDGQHLPEELHRFVQSASDNNHDVVIGTRMDDNQNMPWLRKVTNIFTSWVVSGVSGSRIPDSQNGYRLFKATSLENLVLNSTNYDLESEILVKLAWSGASIGSVPITTVYGDEISSINKTRDTLRFFRLMGKLFISKHFRSKS
ncbi:MAG: glycosyltransferase family 2 protein [bacterium]|nr:glycosyltransferase family 2 protein [bacterium]MCP4799584.1 glycosyltransferase family 2 protein [bacterium]